MLWRLYYYSNIKRNIPGWCCVTCVVEVHPLWLWSQLHSGAQPTPRISCFDRSTGDALVQVARRPPVACDMQHRVAGVGPWCAHWQMNSFPIKKNRRHRVNATIDQGLLKNFEVMLDCGLKVYITNNRRQKYLVETTRWWKNVINSLLML